MEMDNAVRRLVRFEKDVLNKEQWPIIDTAVSVR